MLAIWRHGSSQICKSNEQSTGLFNSLKPDSQSVQDATSSDLLILHTCIVDYFEKCINKPTYHHVLNLNTYIYCIPLCLLSFSSFVYISYIFFADKKKLFR